MSISAVMLDTNEIATAPWTNTLKFGGAPKSPANLDFGDLIVVTDNGDMVVIERKSPSDLLNSIKDKHIFKQAAGMRALSPWAYLVVTGVLKSTNNGQVIAEDRVTGWNWDSVQGALLDIQEMGVRVIHCLSADDYEATVIRLCGRPHDKEKVLAPTVTPRVMSPAEVMLTSLPGIGIERAQLLLKAFDGNAARALVWLTRKKPSATIANIGEGIKRAVKSSLDLGEYDEMFVLNSAHYPQVADYLYNAEECDKEILA